MATVKGIVNQLKKERDIIQQQLSALNAALVAFTAVFTNGSGKGARKMSAAARKRISDAQKARWAKVRSKGKPGAKRVMSAAARRKIAAAQRARWAKVKQQKAA